MSLRIGSGAAAPLNGTANLAAENVASQNPGVDAQAVLQDVRAHLPFDARIRRADPMAPLNGRVPTLQELEALTADIADDALYAFPYIIDGCFARAHQMAKTLEEAGVNNYKLFIYGDLLGRNELMSAPWWYHVAPLVMVQSPTTGQPEARIVDPAISPTPLKPEDWIQRVATRDISFELMDRAQYHPIGSVGRQDNFEANMPGALEFLEQNRQVLAAILAAQETAPTPTQESVDEFVA
jgi:hypothetical protein